MAMEMGHLQFLLLVLLSWACFIIPRTHELQASQAQVLLQLRKHLEYPLPLESWASYNGGDMCFIPSSSHMSIKCNANSVTELKITGTNLAKVSDFNGFAVPNQTLSHTFSIDSFVTTLSRLTSLRVLSLVSLGIWGPLPDKIHRLSSLEVMDLSSNFLFGTIPPKISTMAMLQTLTLDDNYFNETIPNGFDSLSNLTILSLKSNQLKGQFPSSLCHIATLTDIALPHNELSGTLPDLSGLTSLHVLDLRHNRFDSELPAMPRGLVTALLSKNSLSGQITDQFSELKQLQHLDLSFNYVKGTPPSSLFSLPNISYLNLGSNMLSGSLPNDLNCGGELGFVDLSSNKLTGEVPSCLERASDKRVVKLGGNCFSGDSQYQHQGLYCKEDGTRSKPFMGAKVVIVIGAVLLLVLLALGLIFLCKRKHSQRNLEPNIFPKIVQENAPELVANARLIQASKLGTQGATVCRLFSFEELREATKNFNPSTLMGEGSGGKLYRGKLENGSYVAIRSLTLLKKHSVQNLKGQLEYLSKLHHPHLVGFMGHCIHFSTREDPSPNKVFLVHEYVPNGNYHTHLSEYSAEKGLKWSDRLAILIAVAKAVHFLHTGVIPGSFNNRLRTSNILLDEHGIAKLSDYGMSIIAEEVDHPTCEVLKQRPKLHDDVYSFGFILLESLVGPTVSGKEETFLLNEMASFSSQDGRKRIVDPMVLTTCSQESLSIVVAITNKCISPEASSRPSFADVLWNLQYAAQVHATADADQKSDAMSQS